MGGTVHGLVNRHHTAGGLDPNANRDTFAHVAAFFDHLSTPAGGDIMTRVASNWGNGTGFDRSGGANPTGTDHSWGVWKLNTSTARPGGGSALGEVYVLLAMFEATLPSAQNMQINGVNGDGVGIMWAFREDGGDPWNGTSNDDGSDTSSSPLWTAGGSTVHCFPMANNPGGDDNTPKNNMMGDDYTNSNTDIWFHGVADDDNVVFFLTQQRTAAWDASKLGCYAFGTGTVRSNATADPYCCWAFAERNCPFVRGTTYGSSAGTDLDEEGGVKVPGGTVHGLRLSYWGLAAQTGATPDPFTASGNFGEFGSTLYSTGYVGATPTIHGWVGFGHTPTEDDFLRFMLADVLSESYDATNKRAALGNGSSTTDEKFTVPWPDSIGEAPGATRTLDGVTF
jgi:hypothetical protein